MRQTHPIPTMFLSLTLAFVLIFELASTKDLNCTVDTRICKIACNERKTLPYSSSFCDTATGTCVCDCRDKLSTKCVYTPFTPCYTSCVNKNPNPDIYLYVGGKCPLIIKYPNKTSVEYEQCACQCSVSDELQDTNDINIV